MISRGNLNLASIRVVTNVDTAALRGLRGAKFQIKYLGGGEVSRDQHCFMVVVLACQEGCPNNYYSGMTNSIPLTGHNSARVSLNLFRHRFMLSFIIRH